MAGNMALLGDVSMGTTFLGGLVGAFSAFMGGEAQQQMYNYQAGVAKLNAQIAQQNATYAIKVGELQAMQTGLQGAQRLGQIKASEAASGLDVNTGSARDVQTSQRKVLGQDVAAIRSNAAKTAYNYEVEGVQYSSQAELDTLAGKNARTAGMIGAASSILGSASSVGQEWMRGQQLGLWNSGGGSNQTFG